MRGENRQEAQLSECSAFSDSKYLFRLSRALTVLSVWGRSWTAKYLPFMPAETLAHDRSFLLSDLRLCFYFRTIPLLPRALIRTSSLLPNAHINDRPPVWYKFRYAALFCINYSRIRVCCIFVSFIFHAGKLSRDALGENKSKVSERVSAAFVSFRSDNLNRLVWLIHI